MGSEGMKRLQLLATIIVGVLILLVTHYSQTLAYKEGIETGRQIEINKRKAFIDSLANHNTYRNGIPKELCGDEDEE